MTVDPGAGRFRERPLLSGFGPSSSMGRRASSRVVRLTRLQVMTSSSRALIAALVAVVVVASACESAVDGPPATPSPTPIASSAAPSATAGPTATNASPPNAPYENAILGYRLALPAAYRRSGAIIVTGQEAVLGSDWYTTETEDEARRKCQSDSGDVGLGFRSPDQDPDVSVAVSRNVLGVSAVEWVTTPRAAGAQPLSTHQKVESVTIAGREAVRLVQDNASAYTTAFVVRANDRMYEIGAPFGVSTRLPQTWLDDIAATFVVIQPAAFPSPTATIAPHVAAAALAEQLASAFAGADANAVARLLPSCWLAAWPLVDGQPPGGVLLRSVSLFTQGLRDRFAAGDLFVTIDPAVQVETQRDQVRFYVRSYWKESDGTTQIDLFLRDSGGTWRWSEAVHHYTRAQMQARPVWFCRSPWITGPNRC